MEWSSFGIQLAKVSHLVGRILKGKTPPSSLTMAQATADLHTTEDPEEVARRQGKFAAEAIASFDAHASDSQMPTTSYDSPASAGATYLSDVVARPACKRRGIRLGVLRIVNDFDILIVSRARGNIIWVAPQYVMMDSGVQPIMIGKKLEQELQLPTWLLAHLPSSHPLATWNGPLVILESHYSLGSE